MEDTTLRLDEDAARALLLVRAIDDADTDGRLLSALEREQLEQDALQASRDPGTTLDRAGYLRRRAQKMLAAVERRHPQLAALAAPEGWRHWLAWGLPVLACIVGAAIDRIGNPHRVNMLSPALLAVIGWNLAIYVWLLTSALLPRRGEGPAGLAALQSWISGWFDRGRRTGRLRTDVTAGFYRQWLRATARQESLWWQQVLHSTAAGWAIGLMLSIIAGGLVRQYRVGWESTLLDVHQVHGLLGLLFAPVSMLLPLEGFSLPELQRMAFSSGVAIGVDEARRWVWLYVALLANVVVVPRLLLAGFAAARRHGLRRDVRIDLRDPYYVQVLARVSPTRVTLAWAGSAHASASVMLRVLEQAAGRPAPAQRSVPWTVLATPKGDAVRAFEIPPDCQPPLPTATRAPAANPARQWLQDLLKRARGTRRPVAVDPVQAALDDADLVLLLPAQPAELPSLGRLMQWLGRPALVIVPDGQDLAEYRSAMLASALPGDPIDIAQCTANWSREPMLLQAMTLRLPTTKRAGFARIAEAWTLHNHERLGASMRVLAARLVRAARETEEIGSGPLSLSRLVNAGEREADQRARQAAMDAVMRRLRDDEAAGVAELLRLHAVDEPVPAATDASGSDHFIIDRPWDPPQAGMAGAATGAAVGAGVDMMTGGLTLGAAAALGALIGGGAGLIAAARRRSENGVPQVQLSDERLQSLTESALLQYLAVVHRGRSGTAGPPVLPSTWRSEVVACVETQREHLAALWRDVRHADAPEALAEPLAHRLKATARRLLARV